MFFDVFHVAAVKHYINFNRNQRAMDSQCVKRILAWQPLTSQVKNQFFPSASHELLVIIKKGLSPFNFHHNSTFDFLLYFLLKLAALC